MNEFAFFISKGFPIETAPLNGLFKLCYPKYFTRIFAPKECPMA